MKKNADMTADEAYGSLKNLRELADILSTRVCAAVGAAHALEDLLRRLAEVDELRELEELQKMRTRIDAITFRLNSMEMGNLLIHEMPALCDAIGKAVW